MILSITFDAYSAALFPGSTERVNDVLVDYALDNLHISVYIWRNPHNVHVLKAKTGSPLAVEFR